VPFVALAERLSVDLSALKGYLKIEHDADDMLLIDLIQSAKEQAAAFLNNDFVTMDENGVSVEQPIPFVVTLAVYRYVGYVYETRNYGLARVNAGGVTSDYGTMPQEFYDMLAMYRRLGGT
jgi:hypothetical protein